MQNLNNQLFVLKGIIMGEAAIVFKTSIQKFKITQPELMEELRNSISQFSEAEAAHMIQNGYKTIYAGASGFFRKYSSAGSRYGNAAMGGFAKANDILDILRDGIVKFAFGPALIGLVLIAGLGWMLETYGDPQAETGYLIFFAFSLFIIVMLQIGKGWQK
jgi:hypothetical protein